MDSSYVEEQIAQYEKAAEVPFDETHPNVVVIQAMRDELGKCGMQRSYRDRFAAAANILITAELTDEQLARLVNVVKKVTNRFYKTYSGIGMNDDAIALMGKEFIIQLRNL